MSSVLDTYLGWELLSHAPQCKRPAWTIDIRTGDSKYRALHGGDRHACANEDCGHSSSYAETAVRIVCVSCGVAELVTGEGTGRSSGSTRHLGYGLQPRRVAGLYLYPGEPFLSWGRLSTSEPFDFLVTAERVERVEERHVVGEIAQGRGSRGAVRWSAAALPSEDGKYGYGRLRWTHVEVGLKSVAAAAKWIAARRAEAVEVSA
ncbi:MULTISPECIES: hypothetical protein [Bacillati]|uniref:hypothetical protein n=1 Tax=Bacillati TaxID=1783272 RepID=UPI003441E25C